MGLYRVTLANFRCNKISFKNKFKDTVNTLINIFTTTSRTRYKRISIINLYLIYQYHDVMFTISPGNISNVSNNFGNFQNFRRFLDLLLGLFWIMREYCRKFIDNLFRRAYILSIISPSYTYKNGLETQNVVESRLIII